MCHMVDIWNEADLGAVWSRSPLRQLDTNGQDFALPPFHGPREACLDADGGSWLHGAALRDVDSTAKAGHQTAAQDKLAHGCALCS